MPNNPPPKEPGYVDGDKRKGRVLTPPERDVMHDALRRTARPVSNSTHTGGGE